MVKKKLANTVQFRKQDLEDIGKTPGFESKVGSALRKGTTIKKYK